MSATKLSVVIPTFNRRRALERTLPALLAQDLPPEDYELIFVVDGSTDGTAEMLRALKFKCALQVLEQPNRGPSAARNKGIQAARGNLVLFLDDDLICPPGLFRHHSTAHASFDSLVVHGPIYVALESPKTLIRYITEAQYEICYRHADPAVGLPFPMMASSMVNSSIRREMLLACGGFDEESRSAEDLELGLRLGKVGTKFRLLPVAVAYELFVKSSREFIRKQTKLSAQGEFYACHQHPEYRPHSELARIDRLTGWKQILRNMAARSPLSPVPLLAPPIWLAERLCRFISIRKTGIRLLQLAASTTLLRAALREAGSWKAIQSEFGMRLAVLMYHHVGPSRPGTYPELTVSPERFERHVRWLARRGYTGICPSDWVRWRFDGKGLPRKPVLLTFDDGYADLAEHALPALRRYGFGAGVFIVTEQVGGTNTWDEAQGSGTHRLMTAEQIRYWATQGIEFGAHSRTHADLTALSADEMSEEIVGSRKDLESILGSRVAAFAFPYGYHNQAADDCVRGAFDLTFLAGDEAEGLNLLVTDPVRMRRTMVQAGDSVIDVECRARWGLNPILRLRSCLRLRTRLRSAARFVMGQSR